MNKVFLIALTAIAISGCHSSTPKNYNNDSTVVADTNKKNGKYNSRI